MGKVIYTMNVSLDGFIETADHSLDWSVVDDELHQWFTDRMRPLDASLYGRRLYEIMNAYWPRGEEDPNGTEVTRDFARVWNATPKFVFSSSLDAVEGNARLVRGDVAEELARVRKEFPGDLEVGSATLAGSFLRNGLVDEIGMVIHPVVLGGGTPFFPPLEEPLRLRLIETQGFASGVTYLGYEVLRGGSGP
ncbi:MAG TPA: dihydrofolate reductase family protein [Candidatus Limnocylindrales bacterium]|nr:dihydrofolate reductase family protein [Candidatus Limnocylindrales bacterium]